MKHDVPLHRNCFRLGINRRLMQQAPFSEGQDFDYTPALVIVIQLDEG